ncbi:MAG: 30S ribosomal protein S12 methylthiotransferase RimO [Candidatus Marinimicrobia bacterium]|nr:30S ribosomal protein S12 methylthiotransferase RimO [Candidatus Neomarinimicrobiota bacterium]
MKKFHIISLGCSKNLVDSEEVKGLLLSGGFKYTEIAEKADVLIINTCGFILPAKEESINTILQAVKLKESGQIRSLIVMGCLSQRYREELEKELPEVDAFFGVGEIDAAARYLLHKDAIAAPRSLMTPGHYAFLKIAEGCNNQCAFCAIPLIRGKQVSLSPDTILKEAEQLADKGVKELIVIAQDTTTYGWDLGKEARLPKLLRELDAMEAFPWIRLHYAHPAHFDPELIKVINRSKSILPYIDIPIQHIHTDMIRAMKRGKDGEHIRALITKLRAEIPNLSLRTTVMVGFPGETEEAFNELLEFVKETRFDRLGGFTYSQEDGTPAVPLGDPIPEGIKQRRLEIIMSAQQKISLEKNHELIGTTQKVLIDTYDPLSSDSYGRTFRDSPDIDNRIIIPGELKKGEFYDVEITDAVDYDLIGEKVSSKH